MAILVLGGAGYIGSHMVDRLVEKGQEKVVVVDSLVTGHRAAVHPDAIFYQGDLSDQDFMRKVFKENPDVDAVIHFAAYSLVGESMEKPLKYFDNNTAGMVKLLEVMNECGVKYIVFSSTAATYGIPEEIPILETTPQNPINPYGESKLMMETIMKWSDQAYGIKYVPLRYFNVAGAKPDGSIGGDHGPETVSYTQLPAPAKREGFVCRPLFSKKKNKTKIKVHETGRNHACRLQHDKKTKAISSHIKLNV